LKPFASFALDRIRQDGNLGLATQHGQGRTL